MSLRASKFVPGGRLTCPSQAQNSGPIGVFQQAGRLSLLQNGHPSVSHGRGQEGHYVKCARRPRNSKAEDHPILAGYLPMAIKTHPNRCPSEIEPLMDVSLFRI